MSLLRPTVYWTLLLNFQFKAKHAFSVDNWIAHAFEYVFHVFDDIDASNNELASDIKGSKTPQGFDKDMHLLMALDVWNVLPVDEK
jgi:hypothetical protein